MGCDKCGAAMVGLIHTANAVYTHCALCGMNAAVLNEPKPVADESPSPEVEAENAEVIHERG